MNAHEPQNDAEEYEDIDFDALLEDDESEASEAENEADVTTISARDTREYSRSAESDDEVERLQKLIARAGVASRRAAEEMIAAGRVTVNDQVVREAGFKASRRDRIAVDGKVLRFPTGPATVILLHKPLHVVTTKSDPEGRVTVADYLPPKFAHLHPVGRLDFDTSGLLLMTDDGELTQLLTHPSHGVEKVYLARVRGQVALSTIKNLEAGVFLEDGKTAPCRVRLRAQTEKNALLQITLREGRNRQVRRMLEHVGHPARALRRVRFGNLSLEDIPSGAYRILLGAEAHELKKLAQRGPKKPPQRRTATRAKIAESTPTGTSAPRASAPKTPRASTRTSPEKAPHSAEPRREDARSGGPSAGRNSSPRATSASDKTARAATSRGTGARESAPRDARPPSPRAATTRDATRRDAASSREHSRREEETARPHPLAQRIERSFERNTPTRGKRDFPASTSGASSREYSREGDARPTRGNAPATGNLRDSPIRASESGTAASRSDATRRSSAGGPAPRSANAGAPPRSEARQTPPRAEGAREERTRVSRPRGSGALHDSKQPRTDRKPRGGGKNSRREKEQ